MPTPTLRIVGLLLATSACTGPADQEPTPVVDVRSYRLGSIGAFAEMVAAGVKTLALSAAVTPAEMDELMDAATDVAAEHGVQVYREPDFLVTDLFPLDVTEGKEVLVIYSGDTLDRYRALKTLKRERIEAGAYEGAARREIAEGLGVLLSYPEWKIERLLASSDDP